LLELQKDGHDTAAPPKRLMNSLRLMQLPRGSLTARGASLMIKEFCGQGRRAGRCGPRRFWRAVQHTRCGRWAFNELSHFSSSVYGKPRPAGPGPKISTLAARQAMSINHLLLNEQRSFGPEEIRVLATAFDAALLELGLVDRSDPAVLLVAKRIMALAEQGERDPMRLREGAIKGI
jgi:hypothetical protein